jgi:hypothetical protein
LPHKGIVQFVDLEPLLPHHSGSERSWRFQAKLDDLSVPLGIKRARGAAVNEEYTTLTEAVIVISNFAISASQLVNLDAVPRRFWG